MTITYANTDEMSGMQKARKEPKAGGKLSVETIRVN